VDEFQDIMRPSKTDRVVHIPITFSRRSEGAVSGKSLFWIITGATLVFVILVLAIIVGNGHWYVKYPLALLLIYAYLFFLRYFVFREGRISDAYETMIENDYRVSTNMFWNIYDVSKTAPYIVYFANGLKGIFIRFDKDVIVGKEDYMEYKHFEGIADMYNVAHTLKLDMVNIDYMDSVGNDPRMDKMRAVAVNASNPELKAILTSIYANLEHEMSLDYTSFDVYLFTSRGREEDLWYNVRQVIEYGLKANYKSYSLIPPEELRKMAQAIFNIQDFSLNDAMKEVINSTLNNRVRPIRLIKADQTVQILGKTREELMKEQEIRRQERKKISKVKETNIQTTKSEELLDLFEGTTALDEEWSKAGNQPNRKDEDETFDDNGIF
jgi:hypothetical protein